MTDEIRINVVPDESLACPGCGAYWGHPDKALDFPNRFKVDSFCKCYNPACNVCYYDPFTGEVETSGKFVVRDEADGRFLGRMSLTDPMRLVPVEFAYTYDTAADAQLVADGWHNPTAVVALAKVI